MSEREIFIEALDKSDPAERAAFLDRSCRDDLLLRRRVEALLDSHKAAGSFLEKPIAGLAATIAGAAKKKSDEDLGWLPLHILSPSDKPGCLGTLGSYEVIEVVGRGGMGLVLRAYDPKLNRIVAIKAMLPELAANPVAVKRFLREAQAAAAISHDHVVIIHAVDETNRPPFIVMEFISGQSLQQKIEQTGSLELKEILRIAVQTAAGLSAAHKQGLVHRDIKPANVLLENGVERVKLTDFGLARAVDDVGITQTGHITGTPSFMSPEQAQGHPVDHRSDLFSLGSVLYTMCTGRPPFRAETTVATLRRVCDDTPRPIGEVNWDVPLWLCAVIDRLMAKHPADRYQSAAEVAELLGQCLAHLQQPAAVPLPSGLAALNYASKAIPPKKDPNESPNRLGAGGSMWGLPTMIGILVLLGIALVAMILAIPEVKLEGVQSPTLARLIVILVIVGSFFCIAAVPVAIWLDRTIREWRYALRTGDWAPGWIIRCLNCGTSKPLATLGWVRLGAYGRKTKRVSCSTCGQWTTAEIVRTSDPAFEDATEHSTPIPPPNESESSWLSRVPLATWIGSVPFAVIYLAAFAELQQQINPVTARGVAMLCLAMGTVYLTVYGTVAALIRMVRGPSKPVEPQPWRIVMFFGMLWFFTTLFVLGGWAKKPGATLETFLRGATDYHQLKIMD